MVRAAARIPLRVVRLTVPLEHIAQRLAADVTSGRQDDLAAAAESLAVGEGSGLEDVAISNDQPITAVAEQILAFLGWDKPDA